mmetsp:Transcript_7400/g.18985  ORF Transcript_7400/g.18985 Transcript_7400/m.18985 type:complete len:282 (-) Transcript_7400:209-1054(-)
MASSSSPLRSSNRRLPSSNRNSLLYSSCSSAICSSLASSSARSLSREATSARSQCSSRRCTASLLIVSCWICASDTLTTLSSSAMSSCSSFRVLSTCCLSSLALSSSSSCASAACRSSSPRRCLSSLVSPCTATAFSSCFLAVSKLSILPLFCSSMDWHSSSMATRISSTSSWSLRRSAISTSAFSDLLLLSSDAWLVRSSMCSLSVPTRSRSSWVVSGSPAPPSCSILRRTRSASSAPSSNSTLAPSRCSSFFFSCSVLGRLVRMGLGAAPSRAAARSSL